MRVRFYIEKRRDKDGKLITGQRPIFMTVAFQGKRVNIATKKNVDLQWWDPEKQRVREEYPDAFQVNLWLNELEYAAGVTWRALASVSEKPGVSDFRSEFESFRPRFSEGFFDVLLLFMEKGNERWKKATFQKVKSVYSRLRTFEKEANISLSFRSMNEEFLKRFVDFLEDKGLKEYTIRKELNVLVWFLNWSADQGYNVYKDYRKFYKKLPSLTKKEKDYPVYLLWDELMALFEFETENTRMERTRDIFLLSCFSGMRFSELIRLGRDDLKKEEIVLQFVNKKSRVVPLNKFSRHILEKYSNRYFRENRALPSMSLVTYNKYLLLIGKEIGFDRKVNHPGKSGLEVPLHDALSSGCSVNTFIMNSLQLGIPAEAISAFTGVHSDRRIRMMKHELAIKEMKKFDEL